MENNELEVGVLAGLRIQVVPGDPTSTPFAGGTGAGEVRYRVEQIGVLYLLGSPLRQRVTVQVPEDVGAYEPGMYGVSRFDFGPSGQNGALGFKNGFRLVSADALPDTGVSSGSVAVLPDAIIFFQDLTVASAVGVVRRAVRKMQIQEAVLFVDGSPLVEMVGVQLVEGGRPYLPGRYRVRMADIGNFAFGRLSLKSPLALVPADQPGAVVAPRKRPSADAA